MKTMTKSAFCVWAGRLIVEHCPYERSGCELEGCWPAALCRLAHARPEPGLWASLAAEDQREDLMWIVLALACLGLMILAFL